MVSKRVVDYIVDQLVAQGVTHLFGVDGANIEDLYAAAQFGAVTVVLAKHEFGAATMADGFSRATSTLGVVAATSGGGSLNLVAGLGESFASRTAVLALVGQPPSAMDGRGSFQDTSGVNGSLNAQALFASVSVYCRRVLSAADVVSVLPDAIAAALSGGPAVLLLPKDVQQSLIDVSPPGTIEPVRRVDSPRAIVELMERRRGPVTIIAGEQVARDDARIELRNLQRAVNAVVATVPDAKDAAAEAGLVTGVMGHPGVERAIAASAMCLLVGTRLPVTARAGLDDVLRRVPVASIGSAVPHVESMHVHSDDLRVSLAQLTEPVAKGGRPNRDRLLHDALSPPRHHGPGIRYRDAMTAIDAALPDDADVVVDAGNSGAAAIHHLRARPSGRFLVALGMGGMGYSFGAAIGMCFARRRRTVVIAGDGSFFMHGMELHTAIQYGLPLTVVLFNNNAHAMCVTREQLFYDDPRSLRSCPPGDDRYSYNRFTKSRPGAGLAAMFPGLSSVDVTSAGALPGALRDALGHAGPSVVSIECSADEIPPFAPFLAAVDHLSRHQEMNQDVAART
ncbi:MAG: acetolactate synthase large subunit [Mycobacterium sp.]|jgi:acetolactate synthase-1/2/3 large subunit|nr:acetolactate synthase large subunit [Mycobacterium sp.]